MKLNKGEAIVRANAKSVVLLTVCASVLACAAGLGCLQGCSPQEAASQGAAPKAEAANGSITLTEWTTETDCSILPRRRSVLAARCRVHGFEAHEPAMRRLPYRHRDLGQAA